jgi:hypothetical protein
MGSTEEIREVGFNRRQFLLRTGTLGAAATVALYPSLARAAGALDPLIDDIAAPALKMLARDTISGLVAFQVPGSDEYSQAQGVTSDRPGGIDAEAQDLLLIDLDSFLPVPDSYAQALAASFTTSVAEIPIPVDLLGPLAKMGEQYAAQMDDALRSLVQSDTSVPLSLVIALMLNFLATQVNPASVAGAIPASPFASLSFDDKAKAFQALEQADAELLATLDSGAPEPMKGSLSGLLKFVGGALLEFAAYTSYTEYAVFDPATKTATARPVGWNLSNYMPGRTTPADGWDEFKGYFQGRTSTETDPAVLRGVASGAGAGGDAGVGGAAGAAPGPAPRGRRKRRHRRRKKARK